MARPIEAETPERELGKYWPPPVDGGLISIPDVPGIPPVLREAADKSARIHAERDEAARERNATRQALQAAAAIDTANDAAAASLGRPMPTDADQVGPAAQAAYTAASRRSDALERAAKHSTVLLATIIRDECPTWLPEAEAACEATRREALETLDRLSTLLDEYSAEKAIASTLRSWPPHGAITVDFRSWPIDDGALDRVRAALEDPGPAPPEPLGVQGGPIGRDWNAD